MVEKRFIMRACKIDLTRVRGSRGGGGFMGEEGGGGTVVH